MFKQSWVLGGLSWLLLLSAASCSSSDKKSCEGAETCACYANNSCNAGLDCRSNVCVNLSGAGGAPSASGFDTKACFACAETACASDLSACKAASGCETLTSCLLGCGADATCLTNCAKSVTPDNITKSTMFQTCALTKCTTDCTYSLSGIGGSGNGSGGAGTNPSGGGSSKAGSSSTSGGGSSVGGATGSGGSPPKDPVSGVNWLSLKDDAAPAANGVNGKLNIDGVFYAYGDPCASLLWDPINRCITGMMCASDSTGTNWGVAIGFDFNNLASVKHAWSATAAGVTGVAWSTSSGLGSVGGLQIWVQNMAPGFNGTCSSMSCNINAPPDGNPSASTNGQMTFASMQKDVWGPNADSYVFNPANISALQFKLPAKATAVSYSLCIDDVGVIR